MTDTTLQVAFITDRNALTPTLVALWSGLQHSSVPLRVAFVGIGFQPEDWQRVRAVIATHPCAELQAIDFDPALLGDVRSPSDYISSATFARLYLHRFVQGKVLYLDGDVLVVGDLAPALDVNMNENCIAASPDYVVQRWCSRIAQQRDTGGKAAGRLQRITALKGAASPAGYVNAGVVLMDMDRLRQDNALCTRLEDLTSAARHPLADQDHLNEVFAGRITLLSPEWNCSWRRLDRQLRNIEASGVRVDPAGASGRPIVLHYHGKHKPWNATPWRHALRFVPAAMEYRLAARRMRKAVDA